MVNKRHFFAGLLLFTLACHGPDKEKKGIKNASVFITTELTEKNACLFSEISYCKDVPAALAKYLPGWKTVWEAAELGGNYAFVAARGKEYALAIRGSLISFTWAAFQNWIYQDMNVATQQQCEFTDDASKAKLAQGAFDGWQNLCKMTGKKTGRPLLSFLKSELKEGARLLITGHSLGGNLATVYASWLWQQFKEENRSVVLNVITFAAPAAGNEAFANDFNKKFPSSIRVENVNDIVPKFPSASRIASLGNLYNGSLSATDITVGYKNFTIPLSKMFTLLKTTMTLLEFTNGISAYVQTNGDGKSVAIPLSGKNTGTGIMNWLAEAGYQHGIERYAL